MLLVESRPARRAALARALRKAGLRVVAVPSIAHVQRWPAGDIVATEAERFTPMWKRLGASHVIVLADSAHQGHDCCAQGATLWLPRDCGATLLADAVTAIASGRDITISSGSPAAGDDARPRAMVDRPTGESVLAAGVPVAAPGSRIELIVRRGAQRRYDMLRQKTAGLSVVVRWDERGEDRRDCAANLPEPGGRGDELRRQRRQEHRRREDRRQPPPFTWEVADFVVVQRRIPTAST